MHSRDSDKFSSAGVGGGRGGGGESNVTRRPEYSERHDLIRNTCYSCSPTPLSPLSPQDKEKPFAQPTPRKVREKTPEGESLTISKPSAFQGIPKSPAPFFQHVTYLEGEKNHANLHSCVVLLGAFGPAFSLPRWR